MASVDGKKLVIRLQYADVFQVSTAQLDSMLIDIRKDQNTAEYLCSLASRLNSSSPGQCLSASIPSSQLEKTSPQTESSLRQAGSSGIEALTLTPSETYTYYAKTAPKDDINVTHFRPTVVVEIYSNEDVNGQQKANDIIEVIRKGVEKYIIQKQSSQVASKASICVMSFLALKPPPHKKS